MTHSYRIAGFGLAAGAAVLLALAAPATARGPAGGFGGDRMIDGAMGPGGQGLFTLQFADLDSDGDGRITEAELTARADGLVAARMAAVDTDGDGSVTTEELTAALMAQIQARVDGRAGIVGQRMGRQAADPAAMVQTMVTRMMSVRDSNKDGVLSGDELSAQADIAALVDRFDTDDDNAWDAEEFAQVSRGRGGADGRWSGAQGGAFGKRR
ncbi:MAG: hypothetical protein KDK53_19065 [Maritimibacter sp.]|nr:hypothetical protein [Maritimibacter sp.]